jgi:hypothetical protein
MELNQRSSAGYPSKQSFKKLSMLNYSMAKSPVKQSINQSINQSVTYKSAIIFKQTNAACI